MMFPGKKVAHRALVHLAKTAGEGLRGDDEDRPLRQGRGGAGDRFEPLRPHRLGRRHRGRRGFAWTDCREVYRCGSNFWQNV